MESAGSDKPQRRTALAGRKLDRYKVEIAALSETRLTEEGLLKGWCWLLYSGMDTRNKSGVKQE